MSLSTWLSLTALFFGTLVICFVFMGIRLCTCRKKHTRLATCCGGLASVSAMFCVLSLIACIMSKSLNYESRMQVSDVYASKGNLILQVPSTDACTLLKDLIKTDYSNYFDTVYIRNKSKDLTFSEYLAFIPNGEDTGAYHDKVIEPTLEVMQNTLFCNLSGTLKSRVDDSVLTYQIGDKTLQGKDINVIIQTYVDKNVEMRIVYPTNRSKIQDYLIVSVKELS